MWRGEPQVYDSGTGTVHKHKTSIISVACNQYPPPLSCHSEQLGVRRSGTARFGGGYDIMTQTSQKSSGGRIYVLIEK